MSVFPRLDPTGERPMIELMVDGKMVARYHGWEWNEFVVKAVSMQRYFIALADGRLPTGGPRVEKSLID